jgi:prepilin-type N-terminal cleavage/methylation domain-containing protein
MSQTRRNNAFTLIELIFVVVILGIVASISSQLIATVYQNYILQRAQHRASLKTELAALQIANRLAAAIPGTLYRIRNDDHYEKIDSRFSVGMGGNSYKGIQWVGADTDSFSTATNPGWSGFCDLNKSSRRSIVTPGSDLILTHTIITNLNGGSFSSVWHPVLFFPYEESPYRINLPLTGTTIKLMGSGASHISEHYKLAWSSYALLLEDGDLYLYYGFDPLPARTIPANAKRSLLLRHINVFRFKSTGETIRFKICKEERVGDEFNVTSCKEKVVF